MSKGTHDARQFQTAVAALTIDEYTRVLAKEPSQMSSTIPFKPAQPRAAIKISALDRLTAAYALVHHTHEAQIVGCYKCLHNEPRRRRELSLAA